MRPVASFFCEVDPKKIIFSVNTRNLQPGSRSCQAANGIKSVRRTAGATLPFMPDWGLIAQGFRLCAAAFSQSAEEPKIGISI